MKIQSRQENMIYLVVWGLLFATPLLSLYLRTVGDSNLEFNWTEVFFVWRWFGVYLLLFLIHNFFLAPLLTHKHKRVTYLTIVTCVVAGFMFYQCNNRPAVRKHMEMRRHKMEMRQMDRQMGPRDMERDMDHDMEFGDDNPPPKPEETEGFEKREMHDFDKRDMRKPPVFVGEHDILSAVVLLLMFGANIGAKYYFRSRRDQRKLQELERQNLEQQLEYLKYQISPHFFMNTLNNIHALVDIDPQKAQDTILELSKMMRFVLYEGDKSGVPLTKEFEFIRTYIKLMQLRYTDKVKINIQLPGEAPDKTIPPLMLISFIENAFKHGISYQHDSFVDVKVHLENDELLFTCRNSKAEKPNQEKGGVGLANVKKRLDLLFGDTYSLQIKDEPDIYIVELKLPL